MKLGIDLGGTKIEIIAFDNGGSELLRRRVSTPQGDYAAIFAKRISWRFLLLEFRMSDFRYSRIAKLLKIH